MERIKQEIISNVDKLQQEVHEITVRLNSVLQQNKKISKDIKALSYEELICNKEYYLNFMTQQHYTIQNLLAINLQLEEFQNSNRQTLKNTSKNIPNNSKPSTSKKEIKTPKKTPIHVINNEESSSDSLILINNGASSSESAIDVTEKSVDIPNQETCLLSNSVMNRLQQYGLLNMREKYIDGLSVMKNVPDFKFKKPAGKKNKENEIIWRDENQVKTCGNVNVVGETSAANSLDEIESFQGNLKPPLVPYTKMPCLVSHAVTPSEIYINCLNENIDAIERISTDYSTHHDSPEYHFLTKTDAKKHIKSYCLSYVDSWQFWYRARVLDWMDLQGVMEKVRVFLVDYGHTLDISYKNLRPLLKKYSDIPECAIKCHLACLYPLGSTEETQLGVWSPESIKAFQEIIGPENHFIYNVVYVDRMNNSWGIDLEHSKAKENDPTIGQLLLDKNLCVEIIKSSEDTGFIKAQTETAQGFSGISSKMTDTEKLETFCKNLDLCEPGNLDEAVSGYKANDEARTCHIFRKYGKCYKLPDCPFDHEPLRKDGYTTDKVVTYVETTLPMQLPNEGETIQIRITSISSLTMWYGHITSNMSSYTQLTEQLNNPKHIQNYKKFQILPSFAELVIVKTNLEARPWCRGQIKDVYRSHSSPDDIVQVFLVDIGETIECKVTDLRKITSELIYTPFQAVLLKLYGVQEKVGVSEDEAVSYCEKNYMSMSFNAKVMYSFSDSLVVKLLRRKVDISKRIIEDGYGQLVEDILPKAVPSKYQLSLN